MSALFSRRRVRLKGTVGTCGMKVAYRTEALARSFAGRLFEESGGKIALRPYKCNECRKHHLTSHPGTRGREKMRRFWSAVAALEGAEI